jgi:hypothetical protein
MKKKAGSSSDWQFFAWSVLGILWALAGFFGLLVLRADAMICVVASLLCMILARISDGSDF